MTCKWTLSFLCLLFMCFVGQGQPNWDKQNLLPTVGLLLSNPEDVLDSLNEYRRNADHYIKGSGQAAIILDFIECLAHIQSQEIEGASELCELGERIDYKLEIDISFILFRGLLVEGVISDEFRKLFENLFELSKQCQDYRITKIAYRELHSYYESLELIPAAFALDYRILNLDLVRRGMAPVLESQAYMQLGRKTRMLLDYDKAIEFHERGVSLLKDSGYEHRRHWHLHMANIANAYRESGRYENAYAIDTVLYAHGRELRDSSTLVYQSISIGTDLVFLGKLVQAKEWLEQGRQLNNLGIAQYYKNEARVAHGFGWYYFYNENYDEALNWCMRGFEVATEQMNDQRLMRTIENCACVKAVYEKRGDLTSAYAWDKKFDALSDSLFNKRNQQSALVSEVRFKHRQQVLMDSLKFEKEKDLLNLEMEKQDIKLSRQRVALGAGALVVGLIVLLSISIYRGKKRSDELLRNILPDEVAAELKATGEAEAKMIDEVTVLFTDFKGFTSLTEQLSPKELVEDIHHAFTEFDRIIDKYGIEKIKTIGDAYMAAGGLPTPNVTHAKDVVKAALEIRDFIQKGKEKKIELGLPYFEIRIGVHTGPVVAGIVGVKKFSYDIWGDTVNTASRMESSGEVGKVNISEETFKVIKDDRSFTFEPRGKIKAKGKGEVEMFFVSLK